MSEPTISNAWQDVNGEKWVRLEERTDAQLSPLGILAIDALGLGAGERVLDIGFGAGQTLLQLRERVGAAGHVTGVDVSPPLAERAKQRIAVSGFTNIDVNVADASVYLAERGFDALFSRFGVMFFEDPVAAFKNLERALSPKGRVGFVCWQTLEQNPWAHLPLSAVQRVAPEAPLPPMLIPGEPGPFRFGSQETLHQVLGAAGFRDVVATPHEVPMLVGGAQSLDEAVNFALEIGPSARLVAAADPALRKAFSDALASTFAPYLTPNGVSMPANVFVVTARA
jgi:SAM-dependent methyltransferase